MYKLAIKFRTKKSSYQPLDEMAGQNVATVYFVMVVLIFIVLPTIVIPIVGKVSKSVNVLGKGK